MFESNHLAEIKKWIEDNPISFGGPLHPIKDENGIIHLCDEKGITKIMMCQKDFDALVLYKENMK